jgi:hypothetical protein
MPKKDVDICLGYIADTNKLLLEITAVKEIVLIMRSRGIRVLQIIDGDRHESKWFGNLYDAPVTKQLIYFGRISALKVGANIS